jgi:hypothetical protein
MFSRGKSSYNSVVEQEITVFYLQYIGDVKRPILPVDDVTTFAISLCYDYVRVCLDTSCDPDFDKGQDLPIPGRERTEGARRRERVHSVHLLVRYVS